MEALSKEADRAEKTMVRSRNLALSSAGRQPPPPPVCFGPGGLDRGDSVHEPSRDLELWPSLRPLGPEATCLAWQGPLQGRSGLLPSRNPAV